MAIFKVKAKFVSNNNLSGKYLEITNAYLLSANTFCEAEEGAIKVVRERERPVDSNVFVTNVSKYSVSSVIYVDFTDKTDREYSFYEVVVDYSGYHSNQNKSNRIKYLIEASSIEEAKSMAKGNIEMESLYDSVKVKSVKETDINESFV